MLVRGAILELPIRPNIPVCNDLPQEAPQMFFGKMEVCGREDHKRPQGVGHGAMTPFGTVKKVLKPNFQSTSSQVNNGCSLLSLILGKHLLQDID